MQGYELTSAHDRFSSELFQDFFLKARGFFAGLFLATLIFAIFFRILFNYYDQLFIPLENLLHLVLFILLLYFLPVIYSIFYGQGNQSFSQKGFVNIVSTAVRIFRNILKLAFLATISLTPITLMLPADFISWFRLNPELQTIWILWVVGFLSVFFTYLVFVLALGFFVLSSLRITWIYRLIAIFFIISGLRLGSFRVGGDLWAILRWLGVPFFESFRLRNLYLISLSGAIQDFFYYLSSPPFLFFLDFLSNFTSTLLLIFVLRKLLFSSSLALGLCFLSVLIFNAFRLLRPSLRRLSSFSPILTSSHYLFIQIIFCLFVLFSVTIFILRYGSFLTMEVSKDPFLVRNFPQAVLLFSTVILMLYLTIISAVSKLKSFNAELASLARCHWFRIVYTFTFQVNLIFLIVSSYFSFILGEVFGSDTSVYATLTFLLILFTISFPLLASLLVLGLSFPVINKYRFLLAGFSFGLLAEFLLFVFLLPSEGAILLGGRIDPSDVKALVRVYSDLRLLEYFGYLGNFKGISSFFDFAFKEPSGLIPAILVLGSILLIPLLLTLFFYRLAKKLA